MNRIKNEIAFLRMVANEINKVKIRLSKDIPHDLKTWAELYHIKQQLLEIKIAELKKELDALGEQDE